MSDTDLELLQLYARHQAEDAFTEVVHRHLDLVFSAALRQVRSQQLAEEVAQAVFSALARQAERLAPDTHLTAWLYQITRRTAIDVVRREVRRQAREQAASELSSMNAPMEDWTHLEPLLDEAMASLEDSDRTAVLLRYFENRSLREVGQVLGTSEEAARKRVSRAVERLREFFGRSGLTIGTSALVMAVSTHAVQAAPLSVKATIPAAALAAKSVAAGTVAKAAVATSKSGAAAKSATALAYIGAGLAVFGGFYISLRAQTDDTKSPRERQFVLRFLGLRVVGALAIFAPFYLIGTLFPGPLGQTVALAVFLFACALVATLLADYHSRRRRQIQLEDGTYAEAEWTQPRRETEFGAVASGGRRTLKGCLKAARLLAFPVSLYLVMSFGRSWRNAGATAVLLAAGAFLVLLLALLLRLQRQPRFWSLRLGGLAQICGWTCGLTLLMFNLRRYGAASGSPLHAPPMVAVLFNLGVVLAYAVFFGFFAWQRNWLFRRRPTPPSKRSSSTSQD